MQVGSDAILPKLQELAQMHKDDSFYRQAIIRYFVLTPQKTVQTVR